MAARNIEKAIENGHKIIDEKYDISVKECHYFAKKSMFDAIVDAFAYGYLQGTKATKRQQKAQNC